MKKRESTLCPCGSQQDYAACCGLCHGGTPAATAEALMRSRYSAFVLMLDAYLLATWHSDTRPPELDLSADEKAQWLGLEVKRHEQTGPDSAIVEFVARFRLAGRAHRLHEISRFVREGGLWFYVAGDFPQKKAGS